MQHTPNVVDAPITNPVDATAIADPIGRIEQLRREAKAKAPQPTPTIGVVDVDEVDRATAQRCDAPRSIEAQEPGPDQTGTLPNTQTTRPPDTAELSGSPRISHDAENQKPLSVRSEAEEAIARIKRARPNEAIAIAIAQAKLQGAKAEHEEGGWGPDGYEPGKGNQRCLAFIRFVMHNPEMSKYRGDGPRLVRALVNGNNSVWLETICDRLGCEVDDVSLACTTMKQLAGESILDTAVARMKSVRLPLQVSAMLKSKRMTRVRDVVCLVAALAEVHGKPIVFLSGADAGRVLNLDPGGARRSLALAVDLRLIELVRQGYRPNAKAKGMASEYRVPWFGLDTSNSPGNV
jgi:hypothetical protein